MIIAKTRLRKIPENCGKCSLAFENFADDRFCIITKKDCPCFISHSGKIKFKKASWCPLKEVKSLGGIL